MPDLQNISQCKNVGQNQTEESFLKILFYNPLRKGYLMERVLQLFGLDALN